MKEHTTLEFLTLRSLKSKSSETGNLVSVGRLKGYGCHPVIWGINSPWTSVSRMLRPLKK
jgi:hypothetical protein